MMPTRSGPHSLSLRRPILDWAGRTKPGAAKTSSVSVRKRLKNSVKQCQTMRGEMPGQPGKSPGHGRVWILFTRLKSAVRVL